VGTLIQVYHPCHIAISEGKINPALYACQFYIQLLAFIICMLCSVVLVTVLALFDGFDAEDHYDALICAYSTRAVGGYCCNFVFRKKFQNLFRQSFCCTF